jgi:hypothetical protein
MWCFKFDLHIKCSTKMPKNNITQKMPKKIIVEKRAEKMFGGEK